jgi:mevalonate kinase
LLIFTFQAAHISHKIIENFDHYLNTFSYIGEKYFHTRPSGVDNTISINGGLIQFNKMFSFEKLTDRAVGNVNNFNIFLIDSRSRRETQHFIEVVNRFKNGHNKIFTNTIDSINVLVNELHGYLESKDFDIDVFNDFIKINQNLLTVLQVSTNVIDSILLNLKNECIYGKITGAGGGGFILVFVATDKLEKYYKVIEKFDYLSLPCEISKNGFEIIEESIIYK